MRRGLEGHRCLGRYQCESLTALQLRGTQRPRRPATAVLAPSTGAEEVSDPLSPREIPPLEVPHNTHVLPLGEEIWQQTGGRISAFVHSVSTAHSIHGITHALWSHDPRVRIVAVEPAESAVLSGGPTGSHQIEGIGIGFVPPLWRPELVNQIVPVSTADAKVMTRRLATECGIFAGTSSGANVVAALQVAQELGPDATVVTIICDSGLRYLSTDVYLTT